ncbi:lipoprotein, partial [Pseudomonas aeruginosa]
MKRFLLGLVLLLAVAA